MVTSGFGFSIWVTRILVGLFLSAFPTFFHRGQCTNRGCCCCYFLLARHVWWGIHKCDKDNNHVYTFTWWVLIRMRLKAKNDRKKVLLFFFIPVHFVCRQSSRSLANRKTRKHSSCLPTWCCSIKRCKACVTSVKTSSGFRLASIVINLPCLP